MTLRSGPKTLACVLLASAVIAVPALAAPKLAVVPTLPTDAPPAFGLSSLRAPKPTPDMQSVLDAQASLGAKPIEFLTPADARRQPTPADGVAKVMQNMGLTTQPDTSVVTNDLPYGRDPMQKVRIYRPAGAPTGKDAPKLPVVVYYHGGGWVIADLKTYDATPRFMAKELNAIVVSVEYRHAPEAKFPAQHDDAAAAYKWTLKNAKSWGGDAKKVALAGESAGGNLAVATAIFARDHKMTAPLHILAVYPIANSSMTLPSKIENANAKPLNTAMLSWFTYYWSKTRADARDPRINLVAADLRGLPPTTIINAQIDPLRSDGETLATAMRAAGDQVEQRTFPGVTHEFFGMGKVVNGAKEAEAYAVSRLRPVLSN